MREMSRASVFDGLRRPWIVAGRPNPEAAEQEIAAIIAERDKQAAKHAQRMKGPPGAQRKQAVQEWFTVNDLAARELKKRGYYAETFLIWLHMLEREEALFPDQSPRYSYDVLQRPLYEFLKHPEYLEDFIRSPKVPVNWKQ